MEVLPFALVGFGFNIAVQLNFVNVGRVHEALASLVEAPDHESATRIIEEFRPTPARIELKVEAFHTEKHPRDTSELKRVVDHTESAIFEYAAWSDVSGDLQPNEAKTVCIMVQAKYISADDDTTRSIVEEQQRLCEACAQHVDSRSTISICAASVRVEHPSYPVDNARLFIVTPRGSIAPFWCRRSVYCVARFLFPGLGAAYRFLFHYSLSTSRYNLVKKVSIHHVVLDMSTLADVV